MEKENSSTEFEKSKSESAFREEAVLDFWHKNKIFEKSLEKKSPKGKYVFYDGPPFATGTPHYGHLLGSTVKDVIGRYQTMRGFSVPRRWGWDCHGLPIENIVEKDLNISGKKAIEELGINKFVEHARSKVLTYVVDWEKTINRIGRWVDFSNSYKTMDNSFIESVWWALGELNKKELLYEGVRVLAYCPRCETPIANSEIAMDNSYKDITDISVYVKFRLLEEVVSSRVDRKSPSISSGPKDMNTYLLAWTTTPWTLPGNTAIAINKDLNYLFVQNKIGDKEEILIVAKDLFEILKDKFNEPLVVKEVSGQELVGLSYEPIFDYYKNIEIPNKENIWKVWHADFVTADQGTGIAHEAPAFGEDDMNLAKANRIPFIRHVEPNGVFTKEVKDFAGIKVKPKEDSLNSSGQGGQSTDILIIKYLAPTGLLFAKEKIIHSYPHCYRCETPLLYYALPSWFINIQKVKNNLLKDAQSMNWIPGHLKEGRFKNTMESAPDWTISRNRYWASPLPIWKNKKGEVMTVNSVEDLKAKTKKSGNKYFVMRHGEAYSNLTNKICSKREDKDDLTEKGKKQVLATISEIKNKKIDIIFASDFDRTIQTAEIVAEGVGLKKENIIYDSRLWEIFAGIYDGKKWSEYPSFFDKAPKENGEALLDVKKRISEFLYDIENKYANKNILIVTHEAVARLSFATDYLDFNFKNVADYRKRFPVLKNAEVREVPFIPVPHDENYALDLHRPYIDSVILVDEEGEEYSRIPEVIDCWFESGSMPFAQDHYPFKNKNWQKDNFPSGFVAEYIAQTRTWFYYTHVISSILFRQAPFKNIVTTGTILAEDGQKMSKSKNNFPDPWILFNKYGVDALRFYLMSCPVMKGEDINFSEKSVQEVANKIISRLYNVVAFYDLYCDKQLENKIRNFKKSKNVLDQWIIARFDELVLESTNWMNKYEIAQATKPFELFIEDLSTWYLRRSRERIKNGDLEAKQTLYYVLKTLTKLMAPFTPFSSEDIWQKLKTDKDTESVHLAVWPKVSKNFLNGLFSGKTKTVIEEMEEAREIVSLGLQKRQKAGLPVRQPLNVLKVKSLKLKEEYLELIKDELNVKQIVFSVNLEEKVDLDLEITPELKEEGNYRELVRAIQDKRKKEGLTPSDIITLSIQTSEQGEKLIKKFENEIKKTVLTEEIEFQSNDGEEIKIDNLVFKINLTK